MISAASIEAIRDRTDVVRVIGESVKLTRKGKSFVGLCPFHKEKSPSFSVNPDKGFFYCFGCKAAGTAFDFLIMSEGISFPEAARRLAERAGIEIEESASDHDRQEADAAKRATEELYATNQLAAYWFESQLKSHPQAHFAEEELARRELTEKMRDTLQAFRIGYAPPDWGGLSQFFQQQGISPVTAQKLGLIAPRKSGSGFYDWFRHRLMFAVIDVQGRVVGFSGRVLPDVETGLVDKQAPKYINSPESSIYQKGQTLFGLYQARQAIRQDGEAVLVEGNFDVVSLHARGIENVVAPLGTAFTSMQAKLLRRYAPNVVLLFDGDAAGRKATRESRGTCKEAGIRAKVAAMPPGKDPDEVVRTRGAEAMRGVIRAARGLLEHLIEGALEDGFASGDAHERAARVREVTQLLTDEDDPTVRALAQSYADTIAQRLGLIDATSFRQLQGVINRALAVGPPAPDDSREMSTSSARGGKISQRILGCFLDFPELLDEPGAEEAIQLLEGDEALAIAAMRQIDAATTKMRNGLYAAEFLAHLPPSLHTFAAQRLAFPAYEHVELARSELLENSRRLKGLGALLENEQGVRFLRKIDRQPDPAVEDAELRECVRRARERHGL